LSSVQNVEGRLHHVEEITPNMDAYLHIYVSAVLFKLFRDSVHVIWSPTCSLVSDAPMDAVGLEFLGY
jgi:hypothetical protein